MHLYSLSLQKSSAIAKAVYGNFSSPKAHEFVVSRGKLLELLRPDTEGKLRSVCQREVFGVVRSIQAFRLTGGNLDYLVVGSDSGRVVILKYDSKACGWERVHCETYGKTGCRRIVPGQFVAVDPQGRSIMFAALEKQKMVYVMNRDASTRLTISSPLEAHKSQTVVYDLCGVDVAFDNPVFAAIELSYTDADEDPTGEAVVEAEKTLTMYELDLGLNHVVRKWAEPTDRGANMVLAVPGGADGPGGVLVCAENWVLYRNMDEAQDEVRTPIPRRVDTADERGVLIVAAAMHKQKGLFFFLLQSEYGDLYKVSVKFQEQTGLVTDVVVKYFDTLPVSNALCITKTGLLFAAAEFGDHSLYQFQSIGEGDDTVEAHAIKNTGEDLEVTAPVFAPRALTNLELMDSLNSLAPCLSCLCVPATSCPPHKDAYATRLASKVAEIAGPELSVGASLIGYEPRQASE